MTAPFVYEAPATCPPEREFRRRVAGWLDASEDHATVTFENGRLHVEPHPDDRGDRAFAGEASLPRSGTVRDLHAATCEELVTAFAFVFAVDLDERVLERARPEPPAPTRPPAPAPAPLTAVPQPSRVDPPRQLTLAAAVLSGVSAGVLPHATPREGIELAAQLGRPDETGIVVSPRLRLGFGFDPPTSVETTSQGMLFGSSFYSLQLRADVCPVAFVEPHVDVSICARAETSLLFASSSGSSGLRSVTDVLFGIGGAARAAFRLSPRWSLGVDGGLVPPFGPDRFTVLEGSTTVYATAPLTASAQAFASFRFR